MSGALRERLVVTRGVPIVIGSAIKAPCCPHRLPASWWLFWRKRGGKSRERELPQRFVEMEKENGAAFEPKGAERIAQAAMSCAMWELTPHGAEFFKI